MPLLALQRVGLAFGHLPLFEGADLQIDNGERIALIGRNGSGKSSLLRVLSGDQAVDAGSIWREPGLRISRLDQDVPVVGDRSVFAEVAERQEWPCDSRLAACRSRLSGSSSRRGQGDRSMPTEGANICVP